MTTKEMIKKLQKELKQEGNKEVRIGTYGGNSETIDGIYYDEDNDSIIIY